MAVFKCKMCGGHLEIGDGAGVVTCEYCGNKQTIPKFGAEKVASFLEKADNFRNAGEFDKATEIYEKLLDNNDAEDPELYWNIALCKYGVKYEKDPVSKEYIPTVNRLQYTSILNDENYKKALELSYSTQKDVYENQAKAIDKIQQEILQISKSEEPYDVFICYKETDESGRRTQDSLYAYKIYERLTKEGLKVFYARVTLEDKIGKYEPYIFAALHSAKVMIVIGSKKEYFEATWVKNEWSRYLQLLKDKAISRNIVPCYKDMDPYDMPSELAYLQAQDMNKVGFEEDLVRGINKIIKKSSTSSASSSTENSSVGNYLKRVEIYLNDGDYENASLYCEKALDLDAENAEAYKYKLFTDYNVKNKAELIEKLVSDGEDCDNKNLNNAIKFGCSELNVIKYLNYRSGSWEKYKNIIKFQTTLENDINEITKQFASVDETDDNVMKQKLDNIFDEYIYNKGLKALSTDDKISILAIDLEYKDAREQLNKIFEEEKAKCANISELHGYDIDNCLRHFQNLNNYMDCNDIIGILEAENEERQRKQEEEIQRREEESRRQMLLYFC